MAQPSAYAAMLAEATRAARLRRWIVAVGVFVIAGFAGSSVYDSWRSYRDVTTATQRELGNLAKALAEQAEGSLQLVDLLLRESAASFESDRPTPGTEVDAKLAARAAGLPQVSMVS